MPFQESVLLPHDSGAELCRMQGIFAVPERLPPPAAAAVAAATAAATAALAPPSTEAPARLSPSRAAARSAVAKEPPRAPHALMRVDDREDAIVVAWPARAPAPTSLLNASMIRKTSSSMWFSLIFLGELGAAAAAAGLKLPSRDPRPAHWEDAV